MRFPLLLLIVPLLVGACGGKPAVKIEGFEHVAVGERITVEGILSLRGSTPFTTLVLETEAGDIVNIESRTIQSELKSLVGMRCAVTGDVLEPMRGGAPRIDATSYDILRLPSGELPVIGVLSIVEGQCVLETRAGARYWMRGDLMDVIRDHAGARMWIVGQQHDEKAPPAIPYATAYWVTGFGVLDEAPDMTQ